MGKQKYKSEVDAMRASFNTMHSTGAFFDHSPSSSELEQAADSPRQDMLDDPEKNKESVQQQKEEVSPMKSKKSRKQKWDGEEANCSQSEIHSEVVAGKKKQETSNEKMAPKTEGAMKMPTTYLGSGDGSPPTVKQTTQVGGISNLQEISNEKMPFKNDGTMKKIIIHCCDGDWSTATDRDKTINGTSAGQGAIDQTTLMESVSHLNETPSEKMPLKNDEAIKKTIIHCCDRAWSTPSDTSKTFVSASVEQIVVNQTTLLESVSHLNETPSEKMPLKN